MHKEVLDAAKTPEDSASDRFPCPSCAEMVLVQAKVCRYCGRDLDVPVDVKPEIVTPPAPAPAPAPAPDSDVNKKDGDVLFSLPRDVAIGVGLMIFAVVLIFIMISVRN